ncbi:MAG: ATP-dependent DNA helicase, partial [Planctomycetaceae bacterium]
FPSSRLLYACCRRLRSWFLNNRYSLYSQGDGTPRTLLLERFRADPRGVLFGADSFWQGVDVPGEALQNVIITKLPFSVPDHPLLEARLEAIRSRGGNPFFEYQVPEAVIRLKQGFGRLIRSATDRGQVVILDPRVRTKRYGELFLNSLPDCQRVLDE